MLTSESDLMRTIDWNKESNSVVLVDQTLLPKEYRIIECKTLSSLCEAIKSLRIRGAPALGAAGGFGIALSAFLSEAKNLETMMTDLEAAGIALKSTRPTAVNLGWGVSRVLKAVSDAPDVRGVRDIALQEALPDAMLSVFPAYTYRCASIWRTSETPRRPAKSVGRKNRLQRPRRNEVP